MQQFITYREKIMTRRYFNAIHASIVAAAVLLLPQVASAQLTLLQAEGGPQIRVLVESAQSFSYRSNYNQGPLSMLRSRQYQEELALSDEQMEKVTAVQQDLQRQMREMFRKSAEIGGDGAGLLGEAQAALREKADERIKEILLPHQVKRLNEIMVQARIRSRGATGLLDDNLFGTLRLTDEQKKELAEKQQEAQRELQEQIRK